LTGRSRGIKRRLLSINLENTQKLQGIIIAKIVLIINGKVTTQSTMRMRNIMAILKTTPIVDIMIMIRQGILNIIGRNTTILNIKDLGNQKPIVTNLYIPLMQLPIKSTREKLISNSISIISIISPNRKNMHHMGQNSIKLRRSKINIPKSNSFIRRRRNLKIYSNRLFKQAYPLTDRFLINLLKL
jgi:hypothetical protein